MMSNWLLNLPVMWMAVVIFLGTYFLTAIIHWTVTRLATNERGRAYKALSQSSVSTVKWAGLLLQAICALVAIAMVHSDNRTTSGMALTLFATGIALSVLLIAVHSRPFTSEISVGPGLLKLVAATHPR
jgi:hypothetical protein